MEITLFIGGLLFVLTGSFFLWRQIEDFLTYKSANGKVIAFEKRTFASDYQTKKGGRFYPVFTYKAGGTKKKFTGTDGSSRPSCQIGDTVKVLYIPGEDEAKIKKRLPLIFGFVFFGTGICLIIYFLLNFSFSVFSSSFAALLGIMLLVKIRNLMKEKEINSLNELKESFRESNRKNPGKDIQKHVELIDDLQNLQPVRLNQNRKFKLAGTIFTIIGIAAIGLALYLGADRARFLAIAQKTEGEVTELNLTTSRENNSMNRRNNRNREARLYYPVVEFKVPGSDHTQSFEHETGSSTPAYSAGDKVYVLYNPENPDEAIIDEGIMNWLLPGIPSVLGLVFLISGIFLLREWRRWQ